MKAKTKQKRRHRRLDVHKKHFNNPFISKRNKKRGVFGAIPIKYKLFLLAAILLIGGGIWFFFYCSIWNINNIKVKGAEKEKPQKLKELVKTHTKGSSFFSSNNLILLDEDKIHSQIKKRFRIKKIDINKEWPDTLSIHIKEHPYAYIWQEDEHYYYSDSEGFIIKQTNKKDNKPQIKKDIPLIHNKKEKKVKGDRITIHSSFIDFIFDLFREFDSKYKDMNPDKVIIPDEAKTVKLSLQQGPSLYFDIREDLSEQIEYLLVIKNKQLEDDFKNKKYIDLRYQNKIYYQ